MSGKTGAQKLNDLRKLMKTVTTTKIKEIQAYIIPYGDAHQSEYLAPQDQRIGYISGFTGSAGTIVVTQDKALLWTDGRYFSQAEKQLDPPEAWTLMKDRLPGVPDVQTWLVDNLPADSNVGTDPTIMTNSTWISIKKKLTDAGLILEPLDKNLVDEIWGDSKPVAKLNPVVPQKFEFTGQVSKDKVAKCFEEMDKNKVDLLVITALDEVAYLLNWRGSDIPYNPVFFAFVILTARKVHIFIDQKRVVEEAKTQLKNEGIEAIYHNYEKFRQFLINTCKTEKLRNVWISHTSSHAVFVDTSPLNTITSVTPVMLMKMIKNEHEIEGMKKAHVKDALGVVKYFAWLEDKLKLGEVVTEISGSAQLEKYRQELANYKGPSFETISAFGPNAATIHYHPQPETNLQITNKSFYLCDTGSQFSEGTTDTTRTWHFGTPTDFERECYTRVFKGQCNLARAVFPAFIIGNYLDTIARQKLWEVGLDYAHGTGHGVGAYLFVHEMPTFISWRPYPDDPGVQAGMFLSNEPGYYEDGKFGIRLENVEMIVKTETKYKNSNKQFLTFETVTVVPIQTKHMVTSLLSDEEVEFLNKYNERCLTTLKPHLLGPENEQALKWLQKETKPIKKEDSTEL